MRKKGIRVLVLLMAVLIAVGALTATVFAAIEITPKNLPNGMVGVYYKETLGVSGTTGGSNFSWKLIEGTVLPDGLSLGATNGVISGTPAMNGLVNFTVQVEDGKDSGIAQLSIDIVPMALTDVTLNKTLLSLAAGEQETLTTTLFPPGVSGVTVSWKTKNPDIATVSDSGRVTAVSPGETDITVTAESITKTCRVRVTGPVAPPAAGSTSENSSSGPGGSDRPTDGTTSSQTAERPSGNVNADVGIKLDDAAKEVAKAIDEAIRNGESPRASVVVKNAKYVPPATLREIAGAAEKAGGTARLMADTTKNGEIVARMYIDAADAAKLPGGIRLGVSVDAKDTKATRNLFEKYFQNELSVIRMEHQGPIGTRVQVAVKADIGFDPKNARIYAYDKKTHSYTAIEDPKAWVDSAGFLHFFTDRGGDIIVSNGELVKS